MRSELVLNEMRTVPREKFLPERLREFAYDDSPFLSRKGRRSRSLTSSHS